MRAFAEWLATVFIRASEAYTFWLESWMYIGAAKKKQAKWAVARKPAPPYRLPDDMTLGEWTAFWLKGLFFAFAMPIFAVVVTLFALGVRLVPQPEREPPGRTSPTVAAVRKELRQRQTYCWYLEPAGGRRRSHFGGRPYMSPGTPWPRSAERSLSFLAQINLSDLRKKDGPDWLPEAGLLLFFADVEAGAWAVTHEPEAKAVRLASEPADLPTERKRVLRYQEKPVYFRRARSWPGYERLKTKSTSEEEEAARESLRIGEPPVPAHQIGGFPQCVQGDWMEWECEMAVRSLDLKNFGQWLETPEAKALEPEVEQWKLLLQIDSDSDTGFHWVDSGTLYYWIKERDARAGDFSRARLVAQFC
jgi:uncharacterized protein YwqG